MAVRILRLTSGMLVWLCLTLAGADALCALPCGMSSASPQQDATGGGSHCKTLSSDDRPADEVISSTGDSCGVEHGRLGPAAESASSRWTLASAPTSSTLIRLPQTLHASLAFAMASRLDAAAGSPRAILPLRI